MASVVRNADETLTVTLTVLERRVLVRWATDTARSPAQQFADVVDGFLQQKQREYADADGRTLRAKYDLLTPAKQAQVDALLG